MSLSKPETTEPAPEKFHRGRWAFARTRSSPRRRYRLDAEARRERSVSEGRLEVKGLRVVYRLHPFHMLSLALQSPLHCSALSGSCKSACQQMARHVSVTPRPARTPHRRCSVQRQWVVTMGATSAGGCKDTHHQQPAMPLPRPRTAVGAAGNSAASGVAHRPSGQHWEWPEPAAGRGAAPSVVRSVLGGSDSETRSPRSCYFHPEADTVRLYRHKSSPYQPTEACKQAHLI